MTQAIDPGDGDARPAAGAPVVQLLVTSRFNLRAPFASWRVQPRAWLDERLDLIARYTAMSIRHQTDADFTWAILCDPTTPDDIVRALRALDPRVRVVAWFQGITSIPESPAVDIAPPSIVPTWALRPETTVLVETRLDTDDLLHREFLAERRRMVPHFLELGHPAWLVVAESGIACSSVHRRQRCSLVLTRRGPFQSLFSRIDPGVLLSSVNGNHELMPDKFPTEYLRGRPEWVQVIHGGNVANRMPSRPTPVDADTLMAGFGLVWPEEAARA